MELRKINLREILAKWALIEHEALAIARAMPNLSCSPEARQEETSQTAQSRETVFLKYFPVILAYSPPIEATAPISSIRRCTHNTHFTHLFNDS